MPFFVVRLWGTLKKFENLGEVLKIFENLGMYGFVAGDVLAQEWLLKSPESVNTFWNP